MLGRPVVVSEGDEHGLTGAAIVAATALGRFPDLARAQAALMRPARHYQPDPSRRAGYDALHALFRKAEAAVAPLSRSLADWRAPLTAWDPAP